MGALALFFVEIMLLPSRKFCFFFTLAATADLQICHWVIATDIRQIMVEIEQTTRNKVKGEYQRFVQKKTRSAAPYKIIVAYIRR